MADCKHGECGPCELPCSYEPCALEETMSSLRDVVARLRELLDNPPTLADKVRPSVMPSDLDALISVAEAACEWVEAVTMEDHAMGSDWALAKPVCLVVEAIRLVATESP